MKEKEPTFVACTRRTNTFEARLSKVRSHFYALMRNVGQLSLICVWNSFTINTVKLKQCTTKTNTKTEQIAIALRIRFFETKCDQTFASYCKAGLPYHIL